MKIQKQILERLFAHAKKEAPIEACGYLAGKNGIVSISYELTNLDRSAEHFSFDPREQFATLRNARDKGLEIYATYHSHPASPARPSAEDIRLAYDPNILYVILSLADQKKDARAFKIRNQKAEPVPIEVIEHEGI